MAKINNVLSIVKSAFKGSDVQLIPHKRSPKKVIYYLVQIFDKLDDPRKEFKITYPLSYIIMLAFLAILGNANTWQEIHDFSVNNSKWLKKYLPIQKYGIPSHDTFNRVFGLIEHSQLQKIVVNIILNNIECLKRKLGITSSKDSLRLLNIDGKSENGTGRKNIVKRCSGVPNMAMLNVYDSSNAMCVASIPINEKTNEIPVAQEILKTMDLTNTLRTFDSLHTQKKTIEIIRNNNGHYVAALKGNQDTLHDLATQCFPEEFCNKLRDSRAIKKPKYLFSEEYDHSQFNVREYFIVKVPKDAKQITDWLGLKTFVMCEKAMIKKDLSPKNKSFEELIEGDITETRYFISDLDDLELIAEAIRTHWGVEIFHWHLDVSFSQDANTTMNRNSFANLDLLLHMVLHLLKLVQTIDKTMSIKRLRMSYGWNFEDNMRKLLTLFDTDAIISALRT